ncbi:MAG: amidophosphoribosyltransferase [Bacteroidia bacterium]|nr:MAG: amidophosphoribosyltransferase [Bacteroidia bacterium]
MELNLTEGLALTWSWCIPGGIRGAASPDFVLLENVVPYCFYSRRTVRPLIILIKYKGRPDLAYKFGCSLGRAWLEAGTVPDVEVVVPVPLHWYKRLKRGYNQSEHFARGIADTLGIVVGQPLRRRRYTRTQTRQPDHAARWQNVQGKFALRRGAAEKFQGKHILLVDDVITTGATLSACLDALMDIRGLRISVASIAATRSLCHSGGVVLADDMDEDFDTFS